MSRNAKKKLVFRQAVTTDLEELQVLLAESAPGYWKPKQLAEEFDRTASHIYVVSDNELVCGFAVVMVAGEVADLLLIAVHPNYRRRGYGADFIGFLTEQLRDQGVVEFCLEVRETNVSAIGLYKRVGFTESGRRKGYYVSEGEDAVTFMLLLSDCGIPNHGVS